MRAQNTLKKNAEHAEILRVPRYALRLLRFRGSLSLEYAVFVAVVAAALMGMSVYVMRAVAGRYRQAGDAFGQGRQYEEGLTKAAVQLNVNRR